MHAASARIIEAGVFDFDVPAGPAAQTLREFAEQAGREIVFSPAAVQAATTLNDPLITRASCVLLMPLTANAAAALPALHFDPTVSGSVVIHHANNGQTDRRFRYLVMG